jgi:hypothetical protein
VLEVAAMLLLIVLLFEVIGLDDEASRSYIAVASPRDLLASDISRTDRRDRAFSRLKLVGSTYMTWQLKGIALDLFAKAQEYSHCNVLTANANILMAL